MEPTATEQINIVDLHSLLTWACVSEELSGKFLFEADYAPTDPIRTFAGLSPSDFREALAFIQIDGAPLSMGLMGKLSLVQHTARCLMQLSLWPSAATLAAAQTAVANPPPQLALAPSPSNPLPVWSTCQP